MKHTSIDIYLVIDTFLLLLIGIGPKIALVPFVEITAPLDAATKARIVRKMLTTAGVVSASSRCSAFSSHSCSLRSPTRATRSSSPASPPRDPAITSSSATRR